jgi:hypothetical protein
MEVRLVSDYDELLQWICAWEDLAAATLEPNPFYEHWVFLPALRHFRGSRDIHVLLVTDDKNGKKQLNAVIPLERQRRYMDVPVSAWTLWKYPHCFLTTPLIRAEAARECLATVFDWLLSYDATCRVFELRYIPGEGSFAQLLVDQWNKIGAVPLLWECFTRAFFRPLAGGDEYLSAVLTTKQRSEVRRRAKLLAANGPVTYSTLAAGGDVRAWSDSFLKLESSGWKGREGSALACKEADRDFFVDVMENGWSKGRLLLSGINVGETAVAQNSFFLSGGGAFYFKTGFDEQQSKLAPGFYLECETIRHLHDRSDIRWMDTCTSADNDLYNNLFLDRRTIQTLLVPLTKAGIGGFAVSMLPLLRQMKRSIHSLVKPARPLNGNTRKPLAEAAHAS